MNKRIWLMASVCMAACSEGNGGGGSGGQGNVAGNGGGMAGDDGSGGSNHSGGVNAAGGSGGTATGGTVGTGGKAAGGSGGKATGGNATGGASTGGTGAGGLASVVPVASGDVYRFSWDTQVVEVDATNGGRITVFSQGGRNILSGPSANPNNYGSTFWPSPQSAWGWPPPAEIDPGAYTARTDAATLILESKIDSQVNLMVTKRITVDRAAQALVIVYDMKNTGNIAAVWAPWEITRVAPGGMTFFELGPGGTAPVGTSIPTALEVAAGWHWFDDSALQNTNNMARKTFADGKGWVAHLARADRLLLVKTFDDVGAGAQARDEAEVEIFVDSARKYVEVENQGTALSLGPGATRSWTVRWSLRVVPGNGPLSVGLTEVMDAVKAILLR